MEHKSCFILWHSVTLVLTTVIPLQDYHDFPTGLLAPVLPPFPSNKRDSSKQRKLIMSLLCLKSFNGSSLTLGRKSKVLDIFYKTLRVLVSGKHTSFISQLSPPSHCSSSAERPSHSESLLLSEAPCSPSLSGLPTGSFISKNTLLSTPHYSFEWTVLLIYWFKCYSL